MKRTMVEWIWHLLKFYNVTFLIIQSFHLLFYYVILMSLKIPTVFLFYSSKLLSNENINKSHQSLWKLENMDDVSTSELFSHEQIKDF